MRQTAVVIAPGRGTYNKTELGYLAHHHAGAAHLAGFDVLRRNAGQPEITALDGAASYSPGVHQRGDNASALIHACAYSDFLAIDRDRFDILAVTGNSMGWYIALACAGALDAMGGLRVVNTMGTLMHDHGLGGQTIYPVMDEDWRESADTRAGVLRLAGEIDARADHRLTVSIDLGGMLVLAGNAAGLEAFEGAVAPKQGRYPMRLPGHAAFHSDLVRPVSEMGQEALPQDLFGQPDLALIDGRGGLWHPKASDTVALRDYTLGHQVTETFDFTAAIRTAARDLMPDVFILLGPGTTLGGATAQALIRCGWRGWASKDDFRAASAETPRLLAMGAPEQRAD